MIETLRKVARGWLTVENHKDDVVDVFSEDLDLWDEPRAYAIHVCAEEGGSMIVETTADGDYKNIKTKSIILSPMATRRLFRALGGSISWNQTWTEYELGRLKNSLSSTKRALQETESMLKIWDLRAKEET